MSSATDAAPIDFLDEDVITITGQQYALVSFVSGASSQKSEKCAMKIRGVFATRDEASNHVKKLMRIDDSFDIFLVEMYKWVPVPPDPNAIEDHEYNESYLNTLLKGYKESQLAAKQHFAERKRAVMEQGLDANLLPEERLPAPPADLFTAVDPHPSVSKPLIETIPDPDPPAAS
jgi:hypothetical protein